MGRRKEEEEVEHGEGGEVPTPFPSIQKKSDYIY